MNYENYKELAQAVVLQGVADYKAATIRALQLKHLKDSDDRNERFKYQKEISRKIECSRFFNSNYCKQLTELPMDNIKKDIEKKSTDFYKSAKEMFEDENVQKIALKNLKQNKDLPNEFECPFCNGNANIKFKLISLKRCKKTNTSTYGLQAKCESCDTEMTDVEETRFIKVRRKKGQK